MDAFLSSLSSPTILYGVLFPLAIVQLIALLYIPSILAAPGKPRAIAEAIHCCIMQGFGVLLMTIGSLPTIYSVLAGVSYTGGTYFGLLLVFAAGGGIFLWQDQRMTAIDPVARAVPSAIILITFRVIGQVLLALAVVSFLLSITTGVYEQGWWVMPLLMACYGGLISWCTKSPVTFGSTFAVGSMLKPASPRPAKAVPPRFVATSKKKR